MPTESSFFDIDTMTMYLGKLIWEAADGVEILRCKGLFQGGGNNSSNIICDDKLNGDKNSCFSGGEYMLQGVGDVFELRDMSQANTGTNGPKQHQGDAKFLFVGRGIDK